jgi:hypothetical protein
MHMVEDVCKTIRQTQGERGCPLILLGNSVRGELVEPQIGLFARASANRKCQKMYIVSANQGVQSRQCICRKNNGVCIVLAVNELPD